MIGDDYRALIAEVDADLDGAIRYRETWLNKVDKFIKKKKLEELALMPDDYSDQLDLLAALYCQSGRLLEAEVIINKSASVCQQAGIPFDGNDVLKEVEQARTMKQTQAKRKRESGLRRQNQKIKASNSRKSDLTPTARAQSSAPAEAPAHQ